MRHGGFEGLFIGCGAAQQRGRRFASMHAPSTSDEYYDFTAHWDRMGWDELMCCDCFLARKHSETDSSV